MSEFNNQIVGYAGAGGGKSAKSKSSGSENANTLISRSELRVLFLLSEGEIQGALTGDLYRDTFIDDVPIKNADGSLNFEGVKVYFRPGTLTQNYIGGFGEDRVEVNVNQPLKKSIGSITKAYIGQNVNAFQFRFLFPQLQRIDTSNNKILETSVTYTIDVRVDGGGWVQRLHYVLNGKNTSPFEAFHRIDVGAGSNYELRVTRITPDSQSTTLSNEMIWTSFSAITDAKLQHPNSAVLAVVLSGDQFRSLPRVSFRAKFKKILLPNNYNPTTRTYSGVWNGGFNFGYSNNPAWIAFDLLINNRYGTGDRISAENLNKWSFYAVGQYCDEMIPSRIPGKGNVPRFTCNAVIKDARDAYDVINAIASSFRGSFYWSNGTVTAIQDKPRNSVKIFSKANVLELSDELGEISEPCFSYKYSSRSSRHTVALVTYLNPDNSYKPEVEYVEHDSGLARYGYNPVQLEAFGCTSRDEARRLGLWVLETEQNLTSIVTFKIGAIGAFISPGEVIEISDPLRSVSRLGGRIIEFSPDRRTITLDAPAVGLNLGVTNTVKLMGGSTTLFEYNITGVNGNNLTVASPIDASIQHFDMWLIIQPSLKPAKYAVWSIVDNLSSDPSYYEITAIQYNDSIYNTVDLGTPLEIPPTTVFPPTVPNSVFDVQVAVTPVLKDGSWQFDLNVTWEEPLLNGSLDPFTKNYELEYREGFSGAWGGRQVTPDSTATYQGLTEGTYFVRIRAVDLLNRVSSWVSSVAIEVERPKPLNPIGSTVKNVTLTGGIIISWSDSQTYRYGITAYRVYLDGNLIETIPVGTYYTSEIIKPPGVYTVVIKAVDRSGSESPSGLITTLGSEFAPKNPVGDITISINEEFISLFWTDITNHAKDFTGYQVFLNDELVQKTLNRNSDPIAVDLTGNNIFKVYAQNAQGFKSLGFIQFILGAGAGDSTVPNPVGVAKKFNSSDGGIILTWTDSQNYPKFGAYRLYIGNELLGDTQIKTFSSIIRPPGTYEVIIKSVTKTGLQSIGGITVTLTPEDYLPPDPPFFLVQQEINGTKQFYWEAPPAEIKDIVAYRLRFNIGSNVSWENSHWLKDIPVSLQQFETTLFREGSYTILMKLVDVQGNESAEATFTQVNLFDPVPENVVETWDYRNPANSDTGETSFLSRASWSGVLTNLAVDSNGDLAVIDPTKEAFFDSTFDVSAPGHLKISYDIEGNHAAYYEKLVQGILWTGSNENEVFWTAENETVPLWSQYENYILFPVSVALSLEEYKVRIKINPSPVPGKLKQLKVFVDAPDIVSNINDFPVSALGSRIMPNKPMSVLKAVNLTLQDAPGNAAVRLVVKDKDPVLGALVEAFNSSNVRVAALVDAILVGY